MNFPGGRSRRGSLAISELLNEESIDPIRPDRNKKRANRVTWPLPTNGSHIQPLSYHPAPPDEPDRSQTPSNRGTFAKTKRKRITEHQFGRLTAVYEQTDTPSSEIREELADELGMTKREVQVWFQNRRAKANREKAAIATAATKIAQSNVGLTLQHPFLPRPLPSPYYHPIHAKIEPSSSGVPYSSTGFPANPAYHSMQPLRPIVPMPAQNMSQRLVFPPAADIKPLSTSTMQSRLNATHNVIPRSYSEGRLAPSMPKPTSQPPTTIDYAIAGLTIHPADHSASSRPPARKRTKSDMDLLASAALHMAASEKNHEDSIS